MKIKRELWQRMHAIKSTILLAYEAHADADTDMACYHATVTMQRARRELRETTEALSHAYGRNVLWIECEDV